MGGFAQRMAALGLCLALALTACGKSKPASSSATVPPAAPTTTAPADPYAIPATIDAAYLNRVFLALEHIDGEATRLIVANKQLVKEAARDLLAVFEKDEFTAQTNLWLDLLDKGVTGFKSPPGDLKSEVVRVLSSRADCVYVEVRRDYNAIRTEPKQPALEYVALRPLDKTQDPADLNPTPWMISGEGYNTDGTVPKDPCAG